MKTHRLLTLVSAAAIAGALLVPAMASAHGGRHDHHRSHDRSERWSTPPRKHEDWHHHRKHDKWERRHDRYAARSRVYADGPRRPRRGDYYRAPPTKLHLGNGMTIIYR